MIVFTIFNTVINIKKKLIHITITEENYERLKNLRRTNDSFNDVITGILNQIDKKSDRRRDLKKDNNISVTKFRYNDYSDGSNKNIYRDKKNKTGSYDRKREFYCTCTRDEITFNFHPERRLSDLFLEETVKQETDDSMTIVLKLITFQTSNMDV